MLRLALQRFYLPTKCIKMLHENISSANKTVALL